MRIELARDFDGRIRRELRKAARREIGGMLFAQQIAPGHFKIVDCSVDHCRARTQNFVETRKSIVKQCRVSSNEPGPISAALITWVSGIRTRRFRSIQALKISR